MTAEQWQSMLRSDLAKRESEHLLRTRRELKQIDSVHVELDGNRYVNFASNNYLGLTHHPRIIAAMQRELSADGTGAGAAGLITGFTSTHARAEKAIAKWKGTESAVLLPSGYQANHAAVQTIVASAAAASKRVRFLLDKLSHASLLDAVRGVDAEFRVFPHNQLSKLERLLTDAPADQLQVVVTESIFSMDGDPCDLSALAELKQRRPFILLLDEAHGTGVYGQHGSGFANEAGSADVADVVIATLSKAAGVVGGAVCSSDVFCRSLLNHGRAYIYSTAVPPAVAAAAEEAIAIMRDEPRRQLRVRALAKRVREELAGLGFAMLPGDSPILPIVLGEADLALQAADRLRSEGLLVVAVRPPTVPRGGSRLRVTLSCDHSDDEVRQLIESLSRCNGRK